MHSSGDTDVACLVSGGELTWLYVHSSGDTAVACLVPGCELALFLMCTLLVTQTVACFFFSESELAWFLICTLLVTQMWPVLFQLVSWAGF